MVSFYPKRISATRQSNGLLSMCCIFVGVLSEHNIVFCTSSKHILVWLAVAILHVQHVMQHELCHYSVLHRFRIVLLMTYVSIGVFTCKINNWSIVIDCHIGFHHIANDSTLRHKMFSFFISLFMQWCIHVLNAGLTQFQIWYPCGHLHWKVN